MDEESFYNGYAAGVSLHSHMRANQLFPSVIASMSVTGIAADFDWFADLSGVETLTLLSADFTGQVFASYSYDGQRYTDAVPLPDLLSVNPDTLFSGVNPRKPFLWFRFRLADDDADLSSFKVCGVFTRDIPWKQEVGGNV